jgi:hypothetical protein
LAREIFSDFEKTDLRTLHKLSLPEPPKDLSPQQAAQMEAFLQYSHLRFRHLVATVRTVPGSPSDVPANARITLSATQWQNIVDLHARIASHISSPVPEQQID